MIEFNAQAPVASGKAQPVDIRKNDQFEMLLEIAECFGAVRERGPIAD
jgi:hypothetical protein